MKVVTSFSSLLAVGFMKTRVRNSVTTAVTKKNQRFSRIAGPATLRFLGFGCHIFASSYYDYPTGFSWSSAANGPELTDGAMWKMRQVAQRRKRTFTAHVGQTSVSGTHREATMSTMAADGTQRLEEVKRAQQISSWLQQQCAVSRGG